jgi:iron complex transport system ATP-binding protein
MTALLEIDNLTFGYSPQDPVIKRLNIEIREGEFVAIAGPNGAGKTTLLKLLCGLLKCSSGMVSLEGKSIDSHSVRELATRLALVRQETTPVFEFSVAELVAMARTPYVGTLGFEGAEDRRAVNEAMDMTETAHFADRPVGQLSGGERQRVFIARALAQDTPVILLDEPTSFLDLRHRVGIYDLLKRMQKQKAKTIVTVTHDMNLAAQYCNRILLLADDGRYEYGATTQVLTAERIERVFGVRTFTAGIGNMHFFVPVGKLAKHQPPTP